MKKIKYLLKSDGKIIGKYTVLFEKNSYQNNGNLYLGLMYRRWWKWYPFCDVTVNLRMELPSNTAFIDVNNTPGILEWLIENGFAENLEETCQSRFVTYPKVRFNMDKIDKYCLKSFR